MIVVKQLGASTPSALSGIIETDETFQRESRKGSREWVLYLDGYYARWMVALRNSDPLTIFRAVIEDA